jgi:hypothetical protein
MESPGRPPLSAAQAQRSMVTLTVCQELLASPRMFQMGAAEGGCVLDAASVARQHSSTCEPIHINVT